MNETETVFTWALVLSMILITAMCILGFMKLWDMSKVPQQGYGHRASEVKR